MRFAEPIWLVRRRPRRRPPLAPARPGRVPDVARDRGARRCAPRERDGPAFALSSMAARRRGLVRRRHGLRRARASPEGDAMGDARSKRDRSSPGGRHLEEHERRRREADAARAHEARRPRSRRTVPGRSHRARRVCRRRLRGEPDDARSRRAPRDARRVRHVDHRPRRYRHRPRDRRRVRRARRRSGRPEGDGAAHRRRRSRGNGLDAAKRAGRSRNHHRHRRRRHARRRARAREGRPGGDGRARARRERRAGSLAPRRTGLRAIAQAAHGTYRPLGADGRGLDRLYDESLAPLSHAEHGARVRRVYAEWFAIPLALSIFGIVLDALLGWRPRSRGRTTGVTPRLPDRSRRRDRGRRAGGALLPAARGRVGAGRREGLRGGPVRRRGARVRGASRRATRRTRASRSMPAMRPIARDTTTPPRRRSARRSTSADPKLQQQVLYDQGDARYRLGATTLPTRRTRRRSAGRRRSTPTTARSRSRRRTPMPATTATS